MNLILRKIESLGRGLGQKLKLSFDIESPDLYSKCSGMASSGMDSTAMYPYYVEAVVPFNPEYATLTIGAKYSFEKARGILQTGALAPSIWGRCEEDEPSYQGSDVKSYPIAANAKSRR